jgi:hypothetical protein
MMLNEKNFFMVLFCGAAFGLAHAQPQSSSCKTAQAHVLVSLNELPEQVQRLLGRSLAGVSGISDINGKFNPSDVIADPSIPMRRLVKGTIGDDCIWVLVEHGGRGYYTEQFEFHRTEQGWVKAAVITR